MLDFYFRIAEFSALNYKASYKILKKYEKRLQKTRFGTDSRFKLPGTLKWEVDPGLEEDDSTRACSPGSSRQCKRVSPKRESGFIMRRLPDIGPRT